MSMITQNHEHMLLPMTLGGRNIKAMLDSGAQGNFISPNLVNRLRLPWKQKDEPYRLRSVEGTIVSYAQGWVDMETAHLPTWICGKRHDLTLDVMDIPNDVILGIPWLRASNPRVNWRTGHLQWDTPGSVSVTEKRVNSKTRDTPSNESKKALRIYVIAKEPKPVRSERIPEEYRRYGKLFSDELETGLPEHSRWDHEIPLKPGSEPRFHKIYPLNEEKTKALDEYLAENERKGYIRPSTSSAGFPILFVPKKNGKLRLCVDYRQLNNITIKNRYPLPLITELQDKLHSAKWFTTLDLKGAYNLIRIKEGEEWKTAFRTKRGLYEYLVMPFGLTNAPASFQTMINDVLREYLDIFVVVYLDDILIFSKTLEEHRGHVHKILQKLEKANLLVEAEKCEFHKQKVKFLGYEIMPGFIGMDPDKIKAVKDWPPPTNVKEVRAFLGFVNFYRRYVKDFGGVAIPLTDLTKKDQSFVWGDKEQEAFDTIKNKMLEEPIHALPDPSKPFEVETDASDWALGGQLAQRDEQGRLHPVAFYSKKLSGPALNYPIHDKELMAIIEAFKEWKHYLSGTTETVKVYTDHKNLTSFTTTKELNKRQVRWYEFLSEFNFEIIYRKGSENGRADALSRREDLKPPTEVQRAAILRETDQGTLQLGSRQVNATWKVEPDQEWIQRIRQAYESDELASNWETNPACSKEQDTILFNSCYYVPKALQDELVKEFHEHPLHGHQGIHKTLTRLRRTWDFPESRKTTQRIVKECDICNKAKANRHAPYGQLQPISPPDKAWHTVAMDFIVKLPPSKEPMTDAIFDSILVVTEKLTKYAYFVPYKESSTAEDIAFTFSKIVISQHGLPKRIITDRDKLFTSKFWTSLMQQLGIKHSLSTAFHPQTDGQTERLNQTLEQYLRSYVNYDQDNWVELLPTAQWAYNSSDNEAIRMTPFEANHGYNPTITVQQPEVDTPRATKTATSLQQTHAHLQQEWIFLQNRMKHYADQKRLEGPTLKEGDKVYLLRRNIKTKRPSEKLDWKKLGPFKIQKKLSEVNYKLSLPQGMRMHPIFHISLLEPAPKKAALETNIEVEEPQEYNVERILDSREGEHETEYYIKWEGYGHAENTWEPSSHLRKCPQLIRQYHQERAARNHQAPRPNRSRREPPTTAH